jgi:glutathione S-transferase
MLTLYFSPGSSAMATHIALHEVGVAFEARPTLLYQNAHRSPEYLAINAEGKVPTLVIDGRPLTEVAATLWYLARQYPDAGLLPQQGDFEAEARVISWMCSSPRRFIRRAGSAWTAGGRCSRLPSGDWAAATGPSSAIRSQISTCSGSFGATSPLCTPTQPRFRG